MHSVPRPGAGPWGEPSSLPRPPSPRCAPCPVPRPGTGSPSSPPTAFRDPRFPAVLSLPRPYVPRPPLRSILNWGSNQASGCSVWGADPRDGIWDVLVSPPCEGLRSHGAALWDHPCRWEVAHVPFGWDGWVLRPPGICVRWGCSGAEADVAPGAASPGCRCRRRRRRSVPHDAGRAMPQPGDTVVCCVPPTPPRGAPLAPPQTPVAPRVPCPLPQLRSPLGSGFHPVPSSCVVVWGR